jgi:hypothetical protein
MEKFRRGVATLLIIWGIVALLGCGSSSSAEPAGTGQSQSFWQKLTHSSHKYVVPKGASLEVRLDETLSSDNNSSGDTFDATLAAPVELESHVVIPKGAKVTGQVMEATPSGHLKTPAALAITLTGVEVNGESYDLATSTTARRAPSHKKHNAKWIAGGAAGGALLGALVGGGKGAAIGAGVGAGGGTAGAYATGKHEITFSSESLLRFRLEAPVTITE